jgi:serine/threonine-protein kinase
VLYELLAYEIPFAGPDVPAILYKILYEPPRPITEIIHDCPAAIERILERALDKDRENRYQSAEDFELDLRGAADSLKQETLDIYFKEAERPSAAAASSTPRIACSACSTSTPAT